MLTNFHNKVINLLSFSSFLKTLNRIMMKNLLILIFSMCIIGAGFSQEIYYSESFDSGLPDGWTFEGEWVFGSAAEISSAYFIVPDDGQNYACFNDDALGNGVEGGGRLVSSEIDLTTVTGDLFLNINSYFPNLDYQGSDEQAIISISNDMGTTWNEVQNLNGIGNIVGIEFFDLSEYAGQTVWLSFAYDDGQAWNFGWAIESIVFADEPTVPSRSYGINAGGASTFSDAKIGVNYKLSGFVFNNGAENINSFDVVISDGTNEVTETIDGLDIAIYNAGRYSLSEGLEIIAGSQDYTLSIENVNGEAELDEDVSDNSIDFTLRGIEVEGDRGVMVEEATGTWCTWCPRGTVYLDEMAKRFGSSFVGVAVHNNDPMAFAEYDDAITGFNGFVGFPSVIYNREEILDPADIVDPSISDMDNKAPAGITVGAQYDDATGAFVSSIELQFAEDIDADYNVSIILTEDGVSGTGAGWNQINAYGGGGQGPMGGFEALPGSVPDVLMVYDHVGRALIGGYEGVDNVVTGAYVAGDVDNYLFDEIQIDAGFNTDNMHVIGVITDNGSGEVINVSQVSFDEALANGLSTSVSDFIDNHAVEVFPTLVEDRTNVALRLDGAKNVKVHLVNQMGQRVSSVNYGTQVGSFQLEYDMSAVQSGMYFLQLDVEGQIVTRKITKVK